MGLLSGVKSWLEKPMIPGGIVAPCVEAIKGIGELTGSICAGVVDFAQGATAVASSAISFAGGERSAPEITERNVSPVQQQQAVIAAPACKYEAPMSELGCMAPPTFNITSRSGAGVSV